MLYPMEFCATKGLVCIVGSFELDTAEATNVKGDGFVVTRVGAGEYTITLNELYPDLVAAVANFEEASGEADSDATCTFAPYNSSTGAINVRVVAADGTPATDEDFDGDRVSFAIFVQKYTALAVTHT
jgi:hypothetical protein